uniref:Uncharacterized protein n=1 Tax=Oncorhynchus kisutch TaxID=8019 RepID=A0A8C7KHF3_ONCKI
GVAPFIWVRGHLIFIVQLHLGGDSACVGVDVELGDAVIHEVGYTCVLPSVLICSTDHHNGGANRSVLIDVDGVMGALKHGPVGVGVSDVDEHLGGVEECAVRRSDT